MALDKNILGMALHNMRNEFFNNKTEQELITQYGSMDNARLEGCKKEAEVIIDHFKNYAVLNVPGTGLTAGATVVTGLSNTGTLT